MGRSRKLCDTCLRWRRKAVDSRLNRGVTADAKLENTSRGEFHLLMGPFDDGVGAQPCSRDQRQGFTKKTNGHCATRVWIGTPVLTFGKASDLAEFSTSRGDGSGLAVTCCGQLFRRLR